MSERNPVGWFEIYVQDMPRARRHTKTVPWETCRRSNASIGPGASPRRAGVRARIDDGVSPEIYSFLYILSMHYAVSVLFADDDDRDAPQAKQ